MREIPKKKGKSKTSITEDVETLALPMDTRPLKMPKPKTIITKDEELLALPMDTRPLKMPKTASQPEENEAHERRCQPADDRHHDGRHPQPHCHLWCAELEPCHHAEECQETQPDETELVELPEGRVAVDSDDAHAAQSSSKRERYASRSISLVTCSDLSRR